MPLRARRAIKQHRTVYIDPPWPEKGGGRICRGAQKHYPVMSIQQILEAIQSVLVLPPYQMASNAHCYLWATNNYLPNAFWVLAMLGYRYVTCISWFKGRLSLGLHPVTRSDVPVLILQKGLGQYHRGVTEHCLFGVRGHIPYRTQANGKRAQGQTGFLAPRTQHSVKPEDMRTMIERVSPGPYLELFARRPVPGWTVWGNEV